LVAEDPNEYPWVFSGMTVRFGRTMWNVDPIGYQPDHPLFEVMCNVGAVCEPNGWWSYFTQDPDADYYVVTFLSQKRTSSGDGAPMDLFVWTEVPPEFRGGRRFEPPCT
jgi:hypothetical protein